MNKKVFILIIAVTFLLITADSFAQQKSPSMPFPKISLDVGTAQTGNDVSVTLQILLLMTVLSLAPSLVIMTTAYLRIIIVFSFLKFDFFY